MLTRDWLTDACLYIYALSLLFFVSDAYRGHRRTKRIGAGLLVFVWILQTAFLADLLVRRMAFPKFTAHEYAFFVSWLLVSGSFLLNRLIRADLVVLLVNAAGFAVLLLNLLENPHRRVPLVPWEAARRLLFVHVGLILVAFAALTVSAVLGGIYLFLHRRLKKRKWSEALRRLPGLEPVERYSFGAALIGVPLLLMSLSTGTAALLTGGEKAELLDAKVVLAYASGAVYVVYMLRRAASRDDGKRISYWNLLGYALLVVDLFAGSWSSFHRWL
jgi:HemX protein